MRINQWCYSLTPHTLPHPHVSYIQLAILGPDKLWYHIRIENGLADSTPQNKEERVAHLIIRYYNHITGPWNCGNKNRDHEFTTYEVIILLYERMKSEVKYTRIFCSKGKHAKSKRGYLFLASHIRLIKRCAIENSCKTKSQDKRINQIQRT